MGNDTQLLGFPAFQMTLAQRWNQGDWPGWLHRVWQGTAPPSGGAVYIDPSDPSRGRLMIATLRCIQYVQEDDWIVLGTYGELYTCKPYNICDPPPKKGEVT